MAEGASRLTEIAERLDEAARKLQSEELDGEELTELAGECASLASEAVAELERIASSGPQEAVPGQEELL